MKTAPILFQKTYYYPTYFDNSVSRRGEKTGDYSGVLLTRTYVIKKYKNGNHLIDENDAISFSGRNKREMIAALKKVVEDKEEYDFDRHKEFPRSLIPVLNKYNIL